MQKEKSALERKRKAKANKTAKQRNKPRVYTKNVQEKRADSRAKILTFGAVEIIEQRYGGRPGAYLYYASRIITTHLLTVVESVNLKPLDGFTKIKGGKKAMEERLQQYPDLLKTPIEPLPIRSVPTIFKERDPDESIFNELLVGQLPAFFPSQLVQNLLRAFRKMMAAREGIPNNDKDSRSNRGFSPLHLGAWKKQNNPMNLASDTRPNTEAAQEATDEFLYELEEVADILAPVVEELCPRLMKRLHQ
jgi:hypothetical protein